MKAVATVLLELAVILRLEAHYSIQSVFDKVIITQVLEVHFPIQMLKVHLLVDSTCIIQFKMSHN